MKVAEQIVRKLVAFVCAMLILPGDTLLRAQDSGQQEAKISNEQLDSLVAPIALYPDPLLAQTLAASTYPLEIIQLQQWLGKNQGVKDKALVDAVQKQDWDPSIQAMAQFPDLVKQLAENIKWTTDLGNAFLAQQNDVMDSVQRMRVKAKDNGNLKSTEQQKVETQVIESKSVVVIQPASPEVIYVPSYNPTVVYGAPAYPYPPIAYPPPGYYAAGMALSFGVGMAMGAAWGGCCGWNTGWGGGNNNVVVNRNNNFVNNSNRNLNSNRQSVNRGNGNSWQHNPQHRGGAPYSNNQVASKFKGTTRGSSAATRQANARQNNQRSGGRTQAGGGAGAQSSFRDGGGGRASAGTTDRGSRSGGSGGGDRVGNRSVSPSTGSRGSGAFGGSGGGMSGSSARASSQRGSSSVGGGGGSRGGGSGRSGGGRSGGGGRRR
jgi:hypothetical protein